MIILQYILRFVSDESSNAFYWNNGATIPNNMWYLGRLNLTPETTIDVVYTKNTDEQKMMLIEIPKDRDYMYNYICQRQRHGTCRYINYKFQRKI